MARLKEALKELGIEISDENEKLILKEFSEKKELDLKTAENAELKEQLAKRNADIEELKKQDAEGIKAQLDEMTAKYEKETREYQEKLANEKLMGALKLGISTARAKDSDILMSLIDKSLLKFNDKDELEGLSEQIENLRKEKEFLFETAEKGQQSYFYKPEKSVDPAEVSAGSLSDAIADALGM